MNRDFQCWEETIPDKTAIGEMKHVRSKGKLRIRIGLQIYRVGLQIYRVYQKKGNPTLACYCALIAGCMYLIFAQL